MQPGKTPHEAGESAGTGTGAAHDRVANDLLPHHPAPRSPAPGRPPLLDSEALLQGHRTVEIHHQGALYRLQATRQGKLILTK